MGRSLFLSFIILSTVFYTMGRPKENTGKIDYFGAVKNHDFSTQAVEKRFYNALKPETPRDLASSKIGLRNIAKNSPKAPLSTAATPVKIAALQSSEKKTALIFTAPQKKPVQTPKIFQFPTYLPLQDMVESTITHQGQEKTNRLVLNGEGSVKVARLTPSTREDGLMDFAPLNHIYPPLSKISLPEQAPETQKTSLPNQKIIVSSTKQATSQTLNHKELSSNKLNPLLSDSAKTKHAPNLIHLTKKKRIAARKWKLQRKKKLRLLRAKQYGLRKKRNRNLMRQLQTKLQRRRYRRTPGNHYSTKKKAGRYSKLASLTQGSAQKSRLGLRRKLRLQRQKAVKSYRQKAFQKKLRKRKRYTSYKSKNKRILQRIDRKLGQKNKRRKLYRKRTVIARSKIKARKQKKFVKQALRRRVIRKKARKKARIKRTRIARKRTRKKRWSVFSVDGSLGGSF